jgi:hypothetical protein
MWALYKHTRSLNYELAQAGQHAAGILASVPLTERSLTQCHSLATALHECRPRLFSGAGAAWRTALGRAGAVRLRSPVHSSHIARTAHEVLTEDTSAFHCV